MDGKTCEWTAEREVRLTIIKGSLSARSRLCFQLFAQTPLGEDFGHVRRYAQARVGLARILGQSLDDPHPMAGGSEGICAGKPADT